jgi:hypothetical protein
VPAAREEVTPESLHIDRQVRRTLRPVHEHQCPNIVCELCQLLDRVYGCEHVRGVDAADQFRTRPDQTPGLLDVQGAVLPDGDKAQLCAGRLGRELPGDEVRVVLGLGEQDLVSFA